MIKRNHCSFLKLAICLLFLAYFNTVFAGGDEEMGSVVTHETVSKEAATKSVSGFQEVLEPDSIINTAEESFYETYDATRKLWFGVVLVTSDNLEWWKKRIAYDIYMHFNGFNGRLAEGAKHYFSGYISEIEKNHEFMHLVEQHFQKGVQRNQGGDSDYMSAWFGCISNLFWFVDSKEYGPTWIAYVSSQPINGLFQNLKINPASSCIKMVMTVKISQDFYVPLGIYKSPIGIACNDGIETGRLAMLFQSYVARFIYRINPHVRYMLIKPIDSMRKIIGLSKIPYVDSIDGLHISTPVHPHILYQCQESGERLVTKALLVDPETNISYKIGANHWFLKNKHMGRNLDVIKGSLTIDLRDLANYGRPTMEQIEQQVRATILQRALEETGGLV